MNEWMNEWKSHLPQGNWIRVRWCWPADGWPLHGGRNRRASRSLPDDAPLRLTPRRLGRVPPSSSWCWSSARWPGARPGGSCCDAGAGSRQGGWPCAAGRRTAGVPPRRPSWGSVLPRPHRPRTRPRSATSTRHPRLNNNGRQPSLRYTLNWISTQ